MKPAPDRVDHMAGNADSREASNGHTAGLTVRERQVLELVGAGLGEEEISACLRIARSTVGTLLTSSMAKLGAQTRREAVARLAETALP